MNGFNVVHCSFVGVEIAESNDLPKSNFLDSFVLFLTPSAHLFLSIQDC
jgi:hypothetical protein